MMMNIIDEINPFTASRISEPGKLSLHNPHKPDQTKLLWLAFKRRLSAAQPSAKGAINKRFWETRRNVSSSEYPTKDISERLEIALNAPSPLECKEETTIELIKEYIGLQ
jgi:hypothetical protein